MKQHDASSPPEPDALHARWADARARVDDLVAIIGEPLQINRPVRLGRRMLAQMRDWLRFTEAYLRRVLLLQALALLPALMGKLATSARRQAPRERAVAPFIEDDPSSWRVSFPALAPLTKRGSSGGGGSRGGTKAPETEQDKSLGPYKLPDPVLFPRGPDPIYDHFAAPAPRAAVASRRAREARPRFSGDPLPSAKRMEAILRLLDNPLAPALRLARALRARSAPAHAVRILQRPPASNADRWGEHMNPLQRECAAALSAHTDTS